MNREQADIVQFVQIRVLEDGQWKIASLPLIADFRGGVTCLIDTQLCV